MTNADKILCDAALYLDLIARMIDNGAPLDLTLKQLREASVSLDDALFSDLTDEQDGEHTRLCSICRALEKEAFSAKRRGRYAYFWKDDSKYGWIIVKFN